MLTTVYCRNKSLMAFGLVSLWLGMVQFLQGSSITDQDLTRKVAQSFEGKETRILSENPTVDEYVNHALRNNPGIQAAYARWQASIERIAVARGLPDPKINFGYFLEKVQTKVGPQDYKIGIQQMIPWFGKLRLQGDIQALKAEREYQELQLAINSLLYQVDEVLYNAYFLDKSAEIMEQNIALVTNWEVVVRNKYKTATAGHPDMIKSQIESIKLQDDLLTIQAQYDPLTERLRALINEDTINRIQAPTKLEFDSLRFKNTELKTIIIGNNPEYLGLASLKEASDLAVHRARLNYYPDLGLGIDYIGTGNTNEDPLVGMISLSVPLWWKKQRGDVNAARNTSRSTEEMLREKENRLELELEKILFELDDSRRKLLLYKENLIPKSLESLRASEKAYISDKLDFLNLIDAQRLYLRFLLEYERALVRYNTAYSNLNRLTGRKLK